MRRSALKRSKPLKRSGAGSRNGIQPVRRAVSGVYDGVEWQSRVAGMHGMACWGCGGTATDMHHALDKQTLRRELDAGAYAVAVMDPANGIPLCRGCHAGHHAWLPRLSRELLADCHWEFAGRYGLVWLLERNYPGEGGSCE